MGLLYKIMAVLLLAFILPVIVLGAAAYLTMERIRDTATAESVETVSVAEQGRLAEYVRTKAIEINSFMRAYYDDVVHLRDQFQNVRSQLRLYRAEAVKDLYPEKEKAGLPGYGYIHPKLGVYADFEQRGPGCPWLPKRVVERLKGDEAYRGEAAAVLHEVMQLGPAFVQVAERRKETLDLAWIVTTLGATNVYPPYNYYEVIGKDPAIVDLDESTEDYVRKANPENNPERKELWLEPYLDQFKWIWMTSCVAPLYDGDRFLGTVGLDILLPTITERVLGLKPGTRGYAFLMASSGKLIAVPETGIADLVWDEGQRKALRETFLPPEQQHWEPGMQEAILISLDGTPDAALKAVVTKMMGGESGSAEVRLGGEAKLVSFAPVENTGWSLGVVMPWEEVVAASKAVSGTIARGSEDVIGKFVLLAVVILLVSVAVGVMLHYQTIRPLTRLARGVERVTWENLELGEVNGHRRDEIGQLFDKFNEMIKMIGRARDEVTRKTDDLAAANEKLVAANQELERENGERRRAEEALVQEKELLSVTLRSIGDAVITTDTQGRVVLLNRVAEELTGWTQDEALGRPLAAVFNIINEQTREACADPVTRVLESGLVVGLANHTVLVSRAGREWRIEDSGAPIRSRDARVIGVVLVFRDVTEKSRMKDEMAKVQKLESVGLLAAGIAHDFNNLLTAILGNVSIAGKSTDGQYARERLAEAEKAARRARDLTNQLLTFSSGGAPVRRPLRLEQVLKDAAGMALRGSKSRCEFDIGEDLWPVNADAGQISQVVNNLVLNADQAMPRGGTVRVEAHCLKLSVGGRLPLPAGRYVEVVVADQGVGIPRENLGRIFDPFFTTRPGGSGLGLAVCFSIIKKHDGHIEVASEAGKGATFRFYLPAADAVPEPAAARPGEIKYGAGRILVMDDEEMICYMAREMLNMLGYQVELAADGDEAIRMHREARDRGQPFDAVILDLTVPGGKGGEEVLAELKKLEPGVRAIVSSGYSNAAIMSEYASHGFAAVIAKPYDAGSLGETLHAVLCRNER